MHAIKASFYPRCINNNIERLTAGGHQSEKERERETQIIGPLAESKLTLIALQLSAKGKHR